MGWVQKQTTTEEDPGTVLPDWVSARPSDKDSRKMEVDSMKGTFKPIQRTEQNSQPKQIGGQVWNSIDHSRFKRQATDVRQLMVSEPVVVSPRKFPGTNQGHLTNREPSFKEMDAYIHQESLLINPEKICEKQDIWVQSSPCDPLNSHFAKLKPSGGPGYSSRLDLSDSIRGSKEKSN